MFRQRPRPILILVTAVMLLALLDRGQVASAAPATCPAGQVRVDPPGMCVPESQAPGSPEAGSEAPADQPGDSLWSLDASANATPDAGAVQKAVADGAIVSLTLWHFACEAGTDPQTVTPAGIAACTSDAAPAAEYEWYSGATKIDTVSLQTADGEMGRATWTSTADAPIAAGNLQFLVRPAEGWESTWVTCRIVDASGHETVKTPMLNGTAFAIVGEPGDAITCAWFLVSTGAVSAAVSTPVQATPADQPADGQTSLSVTFLGCPDSVTQESDQAALEGACTEETEARPILLTIDGEPSGGTVTGSETWTFSETISIDIGLAHDSLPVCTSQWPATTGAEAAPKDTFEIVGGMLTVTVGHPETTVTCEWFVFQT